MKTAAFSLLVLATAAFAAETSGISGSITGNWTLKGATYTYEFMFRPDGSVERTMNMDTITVWTGSGKYTLKGDKLALTLDNTASNTIHREQYTVKEITPATLKLRCCGIYFTDIPSPDITLQKHK